MFEFLAFLLLILVLVLGFRFLFQLVQKINTNIRDLINQTSKKQTERVLQLEKMLGENNESIKLVVAQFIALNDKMRSSTEQLIQIELLIKTHYLETLKRELLATQDILAFMSEMIMKDRKAGVEVTNEMVVAFRNREAEVITLEETIRNYEKEV